MNYLIKLFQFGDLAPYFAQWSDHDVNVLYLGISSNPASLPHVKYP